MAEARRMSDDFAAPEKKPKRMLKIAMEGNIGKLFFF